ncbi:MAG TPA: tripartite tricarboxylate transporter substrate binding protein [Candidatus Methylomirabilis sp.]|nr:tripartite tricarboxylate transporter substrate binding protein [Candidatus Methylomirabilis sp.]
MKKPCVSRSIVLAVLLMFGLAAVQAVAADKPKDYPNKPITIQVGFGAGGSSDVGVRVLAEALKKILGQPVLVENKPGAGSQVMLSDFKNNAKPDGYTLALINIPQLQTIVFDPTRKASFGMKDFQPVANHVQDPGAILVRNESPFKTLEDFLQEAKAKPGQVKASTTGIGSDDHLAVLDLQRKANIRFNIIHLQDTPAALTAALGGHTDVDFDNVGGFLPSAKSGTARILAVMMEQRYPDLPDVPTFKERGIDLVSSSTRGYVFPAGTPMEIVKYMEQSIKQAMEDPEHVKRMQEAGLTLKFMGTEEYGKFLEAQNDRAKQLIGLYRK